MKSWIYVTAVSGTDADGSPTILFEHCVVMARDMDTACRKGWQTLCKNPTPPPMPYSRTHRVDYVIQLGDQS